MGSPETTNPFTPEFAEFVHKTMDEWKVAGLSIAVVDGDDIFTEGFGHATLPDTPAAPDTLWYAGSTTKAFTTATLAHLIESKKHPELSRGWKTPISSMIRDDFVTQDQWATDHLTLEDAASHCTGLSSNDLSIRVQENGRPWTVKDIVRNIRHFPLSAQPRVDFQYNNEGYATLSHVVESLTGNWLGDVIKETIWKPLGMDSTYLDLQQAKDAPGHLSTGYSWDKVNQRYEAIPYVPTEILSGAGAVISSVVDYAKWIKCLLRENGPLSKEVHNDIRRPRFIHNPNPAEGMDVSLYGLAWWRTIINGRVVYWHSGSTTAHGALVYWFPDLSYGVVILTNYPSPVRQVIMGRLVEDKLEVPLDRRYDIGKDFRDAQRKAEEDLENADAILFPNRPKEPRPPSLSTSNLSGKYHAPGFGTYSYAEAATDVGSADRLVADRTDLLWKTRVTLRHVSGDFWVAYMAMLEGARLPESFLAAEFRIGANGKPSGLEITFPDRKMASGGRVFFKRLE